MTDANDDKKEIGGHLNPVLFSRDSDVEAAFRQSQITTFSISTSDNETYATCDESVAVEEVQVQTNDHTPEKPARENPIVTSTPPPHDLITQTDRHGTPQHKAATATTTTTTRKTESTRQTEITRPTQTEKKKGWCRRLLSCCFKSEEESSKGDRESSTQMTASTRSKATTGRGADRYRVVRLLGPQSAENAGRKCLVLDLDETLVHSSFQAVPNPDYIIPVTIENVVHNVYVLKRPGVDEFMQRMGNHYEVVIFTASLSKYADPLLDQLDTTKIVSKRLFRESCVLHDGHYVKDLSLLNRDISQCIIVDNSQMSYSFHPENAIDCFSYIDDPNDVELWEIADFLENIKNVKDVRYFCKSWKEWCRNNPNSSVPKNR